MATTIEYLSPSIKEAGKTDQALLTNHKPEPHVGASPSEFMTLATPLIVVCSSVVSFSGWLLIFLVCHWHTETETRLKPGWSNVSSHTHRYTPLPQEESCPQLLVWFPALLIIDKISSLTLPDTQRLAG
ncbi:unnamed protein product [Mesocestoides corti]|uniref:Uncharacterized protein n=1 Tax=Mesocestoides corti TaxID=53468 RepID=A0A0R3U6Q2_MESCO|nr:unnamed protein product [Mesocestoides corti]